MKESEKESTEVKEEEEECGNKPTWRRRYHQLRETSAAYVIFEPRGREKKKQQNETTVSKVDLLGFYQM
jgi:hypothetical protein